MAHYRTNFRAYKNAIKNKRAHAHEEQISDVIIMQNDLIKSELQRVRNRQIDILVGANTILDKIVHLRKLENPDVKSRKNIPKGSGLSDLDDSDNDLNSKSKSRGKVRDKVKKRKKRKKRHGDEKTAKNNKNKKKIGKDRGKKISQFNISKASVGYE